MKRLFLSIVFCCTVFFAFSQTEDTKVKSHELGLDLFDLAFARTLDVTYEYVENKDFGFGISGRFCFDGFYDRMNDEKYGITPFFRYYFYNKKDYGAKGFYVESFLKLFGGEGYEYDAYDYSIGKYKTFFESAFGVGVGFKYVNRSGFIVDLNIGGGRSFGLSDISPELTGRACILLGYRF